MSQATTEVMQTKKSVLRNFKPPDICYICYIGMKSDFTNGPTGNGKPRSETICSDQSASEKRSH